ncbi:MAG: hypothetical protein ACKO1N_01165 [Erythrobacter sp.]
MLSTAITLLFIVAGVVAALTVAQCLVEARAAYARLVREGEVMRAGIAVQASANPLSLRPAPRRVAATRRPAQLLPLPLPAFAAA